MAITIDVVDLTAKISEILNQAQLGEEVVIADAGVPVARLIGIPQPISPQILRQDKAKVTMTQDFNDPLPYEFDIIRSSEALRRIQSRPRVNPFEFRLLDSTVLIQEDRAR
jgi:prevent-host-death family protein